MSEEVKTTEKETEKPISIDPNLLLDCIDYVQAVTDGYAAIYQNFQKILWTLKRGGISSADAAAATVGIINTAAAKAQAMVPHKDPFEDVETEEDG